MLVVFYGADGSGKSSVISGILEKNPGVEILHFRPNVLGKISKLYRKKKPSIEGGRPYSGNVHTNLFSVIKILYSVTEYFIWGVLNYFKIKSKKKYIIFDRYYLDLAIDQPRMMISGMLPLIRFLYFFVPKPNIQFVFYGDPQIISARKPELTVQEVQALNDKYKCIPDAHLVDTTCVPRNQTILYVQKIVFGDEKNT